MRTLSPQATSKRGIIYTGAQYEQPEWRMVNMSRMERWLSGIGGSAIVLYGLLRRDGWGTACALAGGVLFYRGISGHSFIYQALDINRVQADFGVPDKQKIRVERAVTIERSSQDLYRFWRNFENLPRFMTSLKEVRVIDTNHSHWVVKAPAGRTVEWDAEILHEKENERITWHSLPTSQIDHSGSVLFEPAPNRRGTEVRVILEYAPPAGRVGFLVAKLFREEPSRQIREDLRRFKEMMEAGELPTIEGQPSGR